MFDAKTHWQNVYRNKSPLAVSWYQREPRLSLEWIRRAGVDPEDPLIDVGGGASVLVDCLWKAGFRRLSVLDISGLALASAQTRLGEAARHIHWIEADVTAFVPPHRFALWHDRAVYHFLTGQADRERYVQVLRQALAPGGQLILAAFAIGGPETCSGLKIVQYDAARLGAELGADFKLIEEGGETHLTPGGKSQAFAYFRYRHSPTS